MEKILTGKVKPIERVVSGHIESNVGLINNNGSILSEPSKFLKVSSSSSSTASPIISHHNNDPVLSIDIKEKSLDPIYSERDEDIRLLKEEAAKHAGHESQHLAMVLILITSMIISQVLLVWWKSRYPKSYIHSSMIAMWTLPFGISAYRHWWRFVGIWVIITMITVVLVWRPLMMPNFARSGSSIPRLLYKWFFTVYTLSSLVAVTGYAIVLLTFFGINLMLGIKPNTSLDIGFILLFYGTYYGVLCRDFTDFLVDKLAAQIGYYNPSSALPSKSLRGNICAICGTDNGDKESIDIDGLDREQTLLAETNSLNENEFHHDYENLIEYSDPHTNPEERVFVLTCGHKFHEYCIYGWCLVGKRQVCPFCREKVDLSRLFSALPFQKPHYLYGNLLDFIRYLFAW